MSSTYSHKLNSLQELYEHLPKIVKALNRNDSLAVAAATNPLLAFEYLGYEIHPELGQQIEKNARFGPNVATEISALQECIQKILGICDLEDPSTLRKLLTDRLQEKGVSYTSTVSDPDTRRHISAIEQLGAPYQPGAFKMAEDTDELEKLDPILPLLFRYRFLDSQFPRFSERSTFEKILLKDVQLPVQRIRFRLRSDNR